MRIGILTLTLHTNYGGILQAYALQTVLEKMGHEVKVLNNTSSFPHTNWKEVPKRIVKKIFGQDVVIFKENRSRREAQIINREVFNFRHQYLHEMIIESIEDIAPDDFDCIVVGSDQVWRPLYFKPHWRTEMKNGYLAFTKGWYIKRISYSASFGVDEWEYSNQETLECAEAAHFFDAISVRESSGVELVKNHLNKDSIQVLDPTLLLNRDDYRMLINNKRLNGRKDGILVYLLDPSREKMQLVHIISKEKCKRYFSINNSNVKQTAPIEERILPSVETWLNGFNDADFIITDSFHASIFSIVFKKPFVVITNEERGGSRFKFFSDNLGLSNNVLQSIKDYDSSKDYSIPDLVFDKLEKMRKTSLLFLNKNLY